MVKMAFSNDVMERKATEKHVHASEQAGIFRF